MERYDFEQYTNELLSAFRSQGDAWALLCLRDDGSIWKLSFKTLVRYVEDFAQWKERLGLVDGSRVLIVAQTKDTARRIKAMYSKVLMHFPNEVFGVGQLRFSPVERSAADSCITDSRGRPLRSNVITVSSFENYESTRGSDIAMAHFSEVAYWRTTPQKSAGGLIRAVSSGIAEGVACTMEVMESTANGKSGYFYDEYQEAKEREKFARYLLEHRNDTVTGEKTAEPGAYLWQLWEKGATLSHIRWYVSRRRSFHSHAQMASEAPSDDVECFTFSGHLMISPETVMKVERQERRMPLFTGHLQGSGDERRLRKEENGPLRVWVYPDEHLRTQNRYMVVVDVGGRSESSDFSVITVIDRLYADVEGLPLFNCLPADGRMAPGLHVVARWRGHLRYDLMADMAVELAGWYDQALLVFESNTFDKKRAEASEFVDEGDHILGILDGVRNRYRNVYMRSSSMSEDLKERKVSKVGFQTNRRTKQQMVDRFTVMFEDGLFHDPDERFYKELSIYEQRPDGSYGNIVGAGNHDDIVMTDINRRAVELARRNLARNGVKAEVVQGDGYAAVEGSFDAILTNPPIRAGKALIYSLFDQARARLNPGGALYIVIRKQQGAPSALRHLRETWPAAEVIDRSGGYWVIRAEPDGVQGE